MKGIQFFAVYVLWLREMKKFWRARSRLIGTLLMPLFMLAFLGFGFRDISLPGLPDSLGYSSYLVPGILAMSLLFSASLAGLSLLWDREFGFLKEIMVAPVSRTSIVCGRIAGGASTALLQALLILLVAMLSGFRPQSPQGMLAALGVMILTAMVFIGLGLVFAVNMRDMQGFNLVMSLVVFPVFLLSGAIFPRRNLPFFLPELARLNPLHYGVDGLRAALLGQSEHSLALNLGILALCALTMVGLGGLLFARSEST